MKKVHVVQLTDEEREQLLTLTRKGETKARKVRRAHVLLRADNGQTDERIQAARSASATMVYQTRQKYAQGGLDAALTEKPRTGGPRKLDAKGEALLVATACSAPPSWSPPPVARRPTGESAGRCSCWRIGWRN